MRAAAPALLGITLLCLTVLCLADGPSPAEQRPRGKHLAAVQLSRGTPAGFGQRLEGEPDRARDVPGRGHLESGKGYSVREEEEEHDEHDENDEQDEHDEHDEHDDHEEEAAAVSPEVAAADRKASLDLRIAAVFLTGLATIIGMSPFLMSLRVSQSVLLCVRAASAGTMLSLAVVHILPEAIHKLEAVTTFPLASALMVAGVFVAYLFQLVFQHAPHDKEEELATPETLPSSAGPSAPGTSPSFANAKDPELGPRFPVFPMAPAPQVTWVPATEGAWMPAPGGGLTWAPAQEGGMVHECCSCVVEDETGSQAGPDRQVSVSTDDRISDIVVIRSMEMGCIVHSLILGLSLGLEPEFATAGILLTVYTIHQFLEGLCLGYLINGLKSRMEKASAVTATMLAMPLGVVIGLLVSQYGDTTTASNSAGPVTASVSSVAGGLLLYNTLTNFLGEDLKRSDVLSNGKLRAAMAVAFFVGLSAMTSIAAGEAASGDVH